MLSFADQILQSVYQSGYLLVVWLSPCPTVFGGDVHLGHGGNGCKGTNKPPPFSPPPPSSLGEVVSQTELPHCSGTMGQKLCVNTAIV